MKNKKLPGFTIALIAMVVLSFYKLQQTSKNPLASWKDYSDQELSIKLKYPPSWILVKDPINQFGTGLTISSSPDYCSACSDREKEYFHLIYIGLNYQDEFATKSTNAKDYLEKKKQFYLDDTLEAKKNNIFPFVPGFTQEYIGMDENVFDDQEISVAEVTPYIPPVKGTQLIRKEYVVLVAKKAYTIKMIYPERIETYVSKIAKSIDFNSP